MHPAKTKNRWLILLVLFINQICIGGSYAWSVFALPLTEANGWDYSQVTLAYSLLLLCISFVGIAGGKLLDRFGARLLMIGSSVLWGLGWLLTGFAASLPQLYLFFGLFAGIGGGLFYNPAITTAVRWFPDKKGLASGMIVGAAGLAPLVLAPVATALLERYQVMNAFKILGVIFLAVAVSTTWLLDSPAPDWKPAGYLPPQPTGARVGGRDYTWKEMMSTGLFYLLWLAFLGGSVSGLMVIGHVSGIGQELVALTPMQAAMMVGIMAVANFSGRMLMGMLSDKIGRFPTLMLAMIASIADLAALYFLVSGFAGFVAALVVMGVCFGGTLAVFPTVTSEFFGLKNMGLNYGVMFTGYGIAAIVGPMAAAALQGATGSYRGAFLFAAALNLMALVLLVIVSRLGRAGKAQKL